MAYMAKEKIRASSVPTRKDLSSDRAIRGRVAGQVKADCKPAECEAATTENVFPPGIKGRRRSHLAALKADLQEDIRRFENRISYLERTRRNPAGEKVTGRSSASANSRGLLSFGRELVRQLNRIDKTRTAERYTTVLNSFGRFCMGNDVPLDGVDSNLIAGYETFLKASGVCPNTSSYYMRGLRAIYNRAVEKEPTGQRCPFKYVYTGIDKTVKRAIPLSIIRRIRDLDLTSSPVMDFARDIFLFSFYTRGMSFIDMAYLKKKNLQNGILSYRRQKTGQRLFIKWERPMQKIIDKYDTRATPYLLPIIRDADTDERRQYKNAAHLVNVKLKKLGESLGLAIPLTSYVARHAWASIAKDSNVPLATISEAMGHNSEKITRIYLASLASSAVDRANSRILKSL